MTRALLVLAAVMAIALVPAPSPARAIDAGGALCSLAGWVGTFASTACKVATHAGGVINAGKKLAGGDLGGAVGAVAGTAVKAAGAVGLAAIAGAAVAGAAYVLHQTAGIIDITTRPALTSAWFESSYWRMAAISLLLTLPFLFAAALQALMRSDLTMLLRAAFGYLPLAGLAVSVAVPLTSLLLAGSDEMAAAVSSASGNAGGAFLAHVGLAAIAARSAFLALFVGLLTAAVTIALWVELVIRSAAVYVIVLMLPLFFAAMVWPARRIWAVRAVELLVALILSKFAIVAVLSLGGVALGHALFPGAAAFVTGMALVLLAAGSPWALMRLLPLHELAGSAATGLSGAVTGRLRIADAGASAVVAALGAGDEMTAGMGAIGRSLEPRPGASRSSGDEADPADAGPGSGTDGGASTATEQPVEPRVAGEAPSADGTPAAGGTPAAKGTPATNGTPAANETPVADGTPAAGETPVAAQPAPSPLMDFLRGARLDTPIHLGDIIDDESLPVPAQPLHIPPPGSGPAPADWVEDDPGPEDPAEADQEDPR